MYDTIVSAQRFIYITGWSVYTSISLLVLDREVRLSSAMDQGLVNKFIANRFLNINSL